MKRTITIAAIFILSLPLYSQIDYEVNKRIDDRTQVFRDSILMLKNLYLDVSNKFKLSSDSLKALRKDFGTMTFDTVIIKPFSFTGNKNLDTLVCNAGTRESFSIKLRGDKISCIRVVTISRNSSGTYSVVGTGYIPGATLSAPVGVTFSANASTTRGVIISVSNIPASTPFNYERQITRQ